jgi:hypothetical protein
VLGGADESSLLVTSMSVVAELLESSIDVTAANQVCWGSRNGLVATVSHFPEFDADLEVLRSGRSAGMIEDEVDALWSQVLAASDSLASHIRSSVAITLLTAWGSSGGG